MPCITYYDDHPREYFGPPLASKDDEIEKLKKKVAFAESALCAALKVVENFADLDLDEAGITQNELRDWWIVHQELDRLHREEERQRKQHEQLKMVNRIKQQEALTLLSAEQQKLLGIDTKNLDKWIEP